MLTFEQARQQVIDQILKLHRPPATRELDIQTALGYVLAQDVTADRDYPPFDRATRDGYAVRAAEVTAGGSLKCVGEIKAGDSITIPLSPKTCLQIMTGAAVPREADAVVMIERTHREGNEIHFQQAATPAQNIVQKGSEATKDQTVLHRGARLGYAELGLAAQLGAAKLCCAKKPRVAILATGDEIVPVDASPGPFQIRNSNSISLSAQVREAGGEPIILANATDQAENLREKITSGLQEDVLVLSGGVSMGKYDLVEDVLKQLGVDFHFDAVAIRPGKPAVFATLRGKPIFGLPGNPISTMVTFLLFVAPAIDLLSGALARPLPLLKATLASPLKEKPGMTHFLPAILQWRDGTAAVTAFSWQSSGDTVTMAHANCYLVVGPEVETLSAGDTVNVLLRKDVS
jgi:molybdopterin molybdotransferase